MKFFKRNLPLLATIIVFVLMVVAGSLRYPNFLSFQVFFNLLKDNAYLGITAVGMTFVILSGGIDLSVGAVIGLSGVLTAKLIESAHLHPLLAVAIVLLVGTVFGSGMGTVISKFDLPPFLVTLAGMFLARGAAFLISLESISITNPLFMKIALIKWALPALFLIVLVKGLFLLHLRPFGRNVLAIGGNESSALLMGLPVARTKIAIYALSGLCSALAGVAFSVYTTSGDATAGTLNELDAIAAVVIGGTLLTGGVGGLVGTFFGVLLLGLIQTAITFEGTLSSWWAKIAIGVLLLLFILLQRLAQGRRAPA